VPLAGFARYSVAPISALLQFTSFGSTVGLAAHLRNVLFLVLCCVLVESLLPTPRMTIDPSPVCPRFYGHIFAHIIPNHFLRACGLLLLPMFISVSESRAVTFRELIDDPKPAEEIEYAKRGGQSLKLHVFRPAGSKPGEGCPAIVLIHGGAWIGGTPEAFMHLARYFAERGMVAVNITYRLAKAGENGVDDCLIDCRSALRYLRGHATDLGIDPERIAVLGDSAGGHLAGALGTLTGFDHPEDNLAVSGTPNAMILFNPIVDMTEGEWIRFAVGGEALADRKSKLPDSAEDIAFAKTLSPVFHVRAGQPPALLMHGTEDKIVPVSQAERFAEAAKAVGNRCDLILLPETGHAFIVPNYKSPEAAVVSAAHDADRFLASLGWLQGAPTLKASAPPAWKPRK